MPLLSERKLKIRCLHGVISREAANMPCLRHHEPLQKHVEVRKHCYCTYTNPVACLSSNPLTASGVRSLTAKPVPPLVTMRFANSSPSLHSSMISVCISETSSGRRMARCSVHWSSPSMAKVSVRTLAHLSVDGSWYAVSDMIITAAFNLTLGMMLGCLSWKGLRRQIM